MLFWNIQFSSLRYFLIQYLFQYLLFIRDYSLNMSNLTSSSRWTRTSAWQSSQAYLVGKTVAPYDLGAIYENYLWYLIETRSWARCLRGKTHAQNSYLASLLVSSPSIFFFIFLFPCPHVSLSFFAFFSYWFTLECNRIRTSLKIENPLIRSLHTDPRSNQLIYRVKNARDNWDQILFFRS